MSVLIGTKVKNASIWLPRFIDQIEQLEGDINKIVVIYGESTDNSLALLEHWKTTSKHRVELYAEPYLSESERSGATLAKLKQDLQYLLKTSSASYYLNLDCDLVQLPKTLIPDLMSKDKDLIASMVWTEGRTPKVFFDTYVFRLDGCMFHPYNPPGLNQTAPFTVDSVSTCYLAKREVELAGTYSNPYPHIPFCKTLKDKGYQVWIDPASNVYHIDLEELGILHQPINHPYSQVPFIDSVGLKVPPQQVGAQRFIINLKKYQDATAKTYPQASSRVEEFMDKRPLITASMKVLNESEYINETLTSIYPYVDKIDIVYGPVAQSSHITFRDNTLELISKFPDVEHKITVIKGNWNSKEHVQAKLLEKCVSKWMLFLDADEIIKPEGGIAIRAFCMANQHGEAVYARPKQFYNFLHDFYHVAWSQNPISPWAEFGLPHPFLIWRDLPGLNFSQFHTMPTDIYGELIHVDNPRYQGKQKIIDECVVYHFGNAKNRERTLDKLVFERRRDHNPDAAEKDWWFTGELPAEFVVGDFDENELPEILRGHKYFGKRNIEVTQKSPSYKFKVIT
ncbi:MAG: hypothetical protein WC325_11600 [Candidatus Bathyarchaeia archaeon]|jgi:hypothetical protein